MTDHLKTCYLGVLYAIERHMQAVPQRRLKWEQAQARLRRQFELVELQLASANSLQMMIIRAQNDLNRETLFSVDKHTGVRS